MKRILYITFVYTILMLGVFFFAFREKNPVSETRDISRYNDELYRIYAAWDNGTGEEELEKEYGCRIILSGRMDGLGDRELTELYKNRALVLDFAPEGEVIGKIAWSEDQDAIRRANDRINRRTLVLWLTLLAAGYLFLFAIYWKLLRPEKAMEDYAGEIAKGNLDIPLPISRDNMFGNLTTSFDIMREELRAARDREVEAEKEKKEMALSLSHDIGTPVATIRTACEMIDLIASRSASGDPALQDIREKAKIIDKKAETIRHLSDNILHVSLAETEHIAVTPQEENSAVIEEYFLQLRGYGSILLENSIPQCLVYMDKLRMEQVVDNIVGNSHKYAGTDIRVRFDETEAAVGNRKNRYIRITIRDEGPGVPEEELPLITEKFYRGSDTSGKPGAGLGMYLAGFYMEKQGGGMEYHNDNGFVVELLVRVV